MLDEKLPFQDTLSVHLFAACLLHLDAERAGEIPRQTGNGKSAGAHDPGPAGALRRASHDQGGN